MLFEQSNLSEFSLTIREFYTWSPVNQQAYMIHETVNVNDF